jgi:hypothetical protein
MLQGHWPNMFTGARKDGGADVVEVVKTWSSLILVQFDTIAMVLRSLLCCLSSDSNQNRLAFEAIECLLRECCWMNVHLTQPYGPVFEIRVPEGYGARWSQDGSKALGEFPVCKTIDDSPVLYSNLNEQCFMCIKNWRVVRISPRK